MLIKAIGYQTMISCLLKHFKGLINDQPMKVHVRQPYTEV